MSVEDTPWALDYQDLPFHAAMPSSVKHIFVAIVYLAADDAVFPSVDKLVKLTGISTNVTRRAIVALYEHGVPKVLAARGIGGRTFERTWKDAVTAAPVKLGKGERPAGPERAPNPNGVVYLIGAPGLENLVKIGRTVDLDRRLRSLQTLSPLPLMVLWTTAGGVELERRLHRTFADFRQHGEWFDFGDIDPIAAVSRSLESEHV